MDLNPFSDMALATQEYIQSVTPMSSTLIPACTNIINALISLMLETGSRNDATKSPWYAVLEANS